MIQYDSRIWENNQKMAQKVGEAECRRLWWRHENKMLEIWNDVSALHVLDFGAALFERLGFLSD